MNELRLLIAADFLRPKSLICSKSAYEFSSSFKVSWILYDFFPISEFLCLKRKFLFFGSDKLLLFRFDKGSGVFPHFFESCEIVNSDSRKFSAVERLWSIFIETEKIGVAWVIHFQARTFVKGFPVSFKYAALHVSNLALSSLVAISAIFCCIACNLTIGLPKAIRLPAYSTAQSREAWAIPRAWLAMPILPLSANVNCAKQLLVYALSDSHAN